MSEAGMKVGGSSLSSAANVKNVARLIVEYYLTHLNTEPIVIASAFGTEPGKGKDYGVTNTSLRAADYAYSGDLEVALGEIDALRAIHYKIVDGLRFSRSLVNPNLAKLEEIVWQSTTKMSQAKFRLAEYINRASSYLGIQQKLLGSVTRFLAPKEKLRDAVAGLGCAK